MADAAAAVAAPENPAPATPAADAAPPAPPAEPARTFTQAEVDAIIAGRLKKYADYDTVKSKLAEMEQAGMTAQQKAEQAAAEAIADAQAARAELAAAHRREVVAGAAKDAHDPSEVARLLDVADDADDVTVAAAVKALLAAKPYLVRGPGTPAPTPGSAAAPTEGAGLLTLDEIARLDPRKVAADKALYAQVIKSRDHWAKVQ